MMPRDARAMLYSAMTQAAIDLQKALECSAQCAGTAGLEQEAAYELGRAEAHALALARLARLTVGTCTFGKEG